MRLLVLAMPDRVAGAVFPSAVRAELETLVDVLGPVAPSAAPVSARALVTGWGTPRLDAPVLARLPHLEAVFHAAGSVRPILSDAFLARDVRLTTAARANAAPVARWTLAHLLLAAKDAHGWAARYRTNPARTAAAARASDLSDAGRLVVGLVGAGRVARLVVELAGPYGWLVQVADPYVRNAPAGSVLVDLDTLLGSSRVVSLHAASTAETRGLLDARRLALLPDGATLLNSARGALIDEDALARECASGRISAVLDVTSTEPLPRSSPLWRCPNVTLTPHIAGSRGVEVADLGRAVLAEVRAWLAGEPAHDLVTSHMLATMA